MIGRRGFLAFIGITPALAALKDAPVPAAPKIPEPIVCGTRAVTGLPPLMSSATYVATVAWSFNTGILPGYAPSPAKRWWE